CCNGNADYTCISAEEQECYGDPARNRSDQCTHDKWFTHRNRELSPKNVLQAQKLAQSPHQCEELDRNPYLSPSLSRHSHHCRCDAFSAAERHSSAAATALRDSELSKTSIAAAVCLYVHFHHLFHGWCYASDDVARRSFGLLRHDLWLQIDPSVSSSELVT